MNTLVSKITSHSEKIKEYPRAVLGKTDIYVKRSDIYKIHTLTIISPTAELLKNEINKLAYLSKKNWDTYNAEPISVDAINLATILIEVLVLNNILIDSYAPLRDGGVQLEKSLSENDIEIEIHPNKNIDLLVFDKDANFIKEVKYDVNNINNLVHELKTLDR